MLSSGNDTAKAINYLLNCWVAFTGFLDDGRVCLSNNAAERALSGVVVGRRNWTFADSDAGGNRAAAAYTLTETREMNDVDRQAWLADVLAKPLDRPDNRVADLLPRNWKATQLSKAASACCGRPPRLPGMLAGCVQVIEAPCCCGQALSLAKANGLSLFAVIGSSIA
ncbi:MULTISPECIES: transposase [unclassified Bradyrhizobium]|uniref:IS66 family transposase n=1 Tax=unclassified Bradyrhizobium TaxID=2631580 RepID=UPI0024784376|nr:MULTISPECIES: transposase [unclassified Bradyrhizobium]